MKSIMEKLLIAALDLEKEGHKSFSAEDFVVAAWRKFPDAFGLAGYRDKYPDSNRVFAEIMGSKPIRKKGLLVKTGEKMYQLTDSGRLCARQLLYDYENPNSQKIAFSREIKKELRSYLESKALLKFKQQRASDITFFDFCVLFGVSPGSSSIELSGRLSNFDRIISEADMITRKQSFSFEHGGPEISNAEIKLLIKLKDFLLEKFEKEISIINKRVDERNK